MLSKIFCIKIFCIFSLNILHCNIDSEILCYVRYKNNIFKGVYEHHDIATLILLPRKKPAFFVNHWNDRTMFYTPIPMKLDIINFVILMFFIATSGNRNFSQRYININTRETGLLTFRRREALHARLHGVRFIKSRGMRMKSRGEKDVIYTAADRGRRARN